MTPRGLALALAAAVVIAGCGGVARQDRSVIRTETVVTEAPAASPDTRPAHANDVSSTSTTGPSPAPTPDEPADSGSSTPSTTATTGFQSSTTTSPEDPIDLAEVLDALNALDAVFEGLDGHVDSIDLEEGDTP